MGLVKLAGAEAGAKAMSAPIDPRANGSRTLAGTTCNRAKLIVGDLLHALVVKTLEQALGIAISKFDTCILGELGDLFGALRAQSQLLELFYGL